VFGAPSPSPLHRGRSGDAGHTEKRGEMWRDRRVSGTGKIRPRFDDGIKRKECIKRSRFDDGVGLSVFSSRLRTASNPGLVVGRATASRYGRCSCRLTRLTISIKIVLLANQ
jgi:hypothetical protein